MNKILDLLELESERKIFDSKMRKELKEIVEKICQELLEKYKK